MQAEILQLLRELRDQYGTSIVLITHNMGVVADLADRVVVMYQGDVVEEASARVLFAEPKQDYTKKLLAAVPHLGRNSASAGMTERAHQGGKVLVEAKNLTIEYPGRLGSPAFKAVDGVNFTLSEGEVFGLVGESGSGKTTIGRAIAGLNRTTGGSLKVLDYEMLNLKERTFKPLRKQIGFVFQDPAASFNPQLTIGDCIAEPLIIHSKPTPAQARQRTRELLESVQLPASYADRYPPRALRRPAPARVTGAGIDPEPEAADRRRADVGAGCFGAGEGAGAVQGIQANSVSPASSSATTSPWWTSSRTGSVSSTRARWWSRARKPGHGHPPHEYTKKLIASLPVPDPDEQARRREEFARCSAPEIRTAPAAPRGMPAVHFERRACPFSGGRTRA